MAPSKDRRGCNTKRATKRVATRSAPRSESDGRQGKQQLTVFVTGKPTNDRLGLMACTQCMCKLGSRKGQASTMSASAVVGEAPGVARASASRGGGVRGA
jgi:hypothetical protein